MSDITIAASSNAFAELFDVLRRNFHFSRSGSATFAVFTASYSVAVHLQDGSIALHDDNTVEVTNLEVVWDSLAVAVCFDLPELLPGFCIVPDPWNGCLLGFPGLGGERICVPLDLSGLVSEISDLKAQLAPVYAVDPARLPAWSDLDAEVAAHPNKRRIFVRPVWVSVDPIDVPASAANLLENLVKQAILDLFPSWFPDWAKDAVWTAVGPILKFVTDTLGIVGSIEDWLAGLLGDAVGGFDLLGIIETAVTDYFASQYPIYEFEDPYPVLAGGASLNPIPVKIPIRGLTATVDSHEMTIRANVGA
jgi:hypothetical protein